MKLSLRADPGRPMTRAEAMGCLTANLALPGGGSLAAGRAVGYFQLGLTLVGFAVTLAGSVVMLKWWMATGGPDMNGDPADNLIALWQHVRWALLGIAMFGAALLWALATSLAILAAHPKEKQ